MSLLEQMLCEVAAEGVPVMPHPDMVKRMGAKDALVSIKHLSCGLPDTEAYYTVEEFAAGFPKSLATGPRVLKQNRGSQGEGIWVCDVAGREQQASGDRGGEVEVEASTMLLLTEAVDNHREQRTLADFMSFCEQYLEGADGQLINQKFLPRIVEGELRLNMIGRTPTEVVHKKPAAGGISATLKSGASYVTYKPDHPAVVDLVDRFVTYDLPHIIPALNLQHFPVIWTVDFILGDKDQHGNDTYHVGACVSIASCGCGVPSSSEQCCGGEEA